MALRKGAITRYYLCYKLWCQSNRMILGTICKQLSVPTDRPHMPAQGPHKMVYGIEMTLAMDLMLGDTWPEQPADGCPYEYVEWIKHPLRHTHDRSRKTLKTSV